MRQGEVLGGALTGKTPPAHPDTEKTLAELRARIHSCLRLPRDGHARRLRRRRGAQGRAQLAEGKWVRGDQFLVQMSLPNFYFHLTMAYAILRHNGVDLGKRDFLGAIPLHD